jgi:ribosomal protein S8
MNKSSIYFMLLSNIRDVQQKNRKKFSIAFRQAYLPLLRFLTETGFINGFFIAEFRIHIFVRYYANGLPVISKITKFGLNKRRLTFQLKTPDVVHRPYKTAVISTTKGLMLEPQARLLKIGGLLVFGIN